MGHHKTKAGASLSACTPRKGGEGGEKPTLERGQRRHAMIVASRGEAHPEEKLEGRWVLRKEVGESLALT